MNWDAIGAIGEGIGAVAVVVTLFYLAAQTRQNTRWLKQQAFQLGTNEIRRWASHFHESKETSELFIRGQRDYASLDPVENLQFTMIVFELSSVWATYQQYGDDDLIGLRDSAETTITNWIHQGWYRGWWKVNADMHSTDFKRFVEDLLERTPEKA